MWLQLGIVYFHKVDTKLFALKALSVSQDGDDERVEVTFN